ncbi:DUF2207 domain-containing protein [Balneolales bacterium ANBcel1]|nr:DUF2207 domain-containing protein [Balneolales bacterium ANBcel1]
MNRFPALIVLLLFLPPTLVARDYDIPEIGIQAEITPDGTIRYIEERTYQFDGTYSFVYYTLALDGFESVSRIRVREDGRALVNDNSGEPGTFTVERSDSELRITWYIETEGVTERRYTIQYNLAEALVIGPEHTEWFWTFLSDRLDRTPRHVQVRIALPERIEPAEWHIWYRDTPEHVTHTAEGNLLILEGEGFRSSDVIRPRILFPTGVLADADVTDRRLTLERVEAEEMARIEARKRDEQLRMVGIGLMAVLIPASLLLYIWFYRRYGRRHKTPSVKRVPRYTVPSDHPPAMIRVLLLGPLYKEPDQLSLGITLFDLARRGYFRIVEKKGKKKFLSTETPEYHLEKTGKKPAEDLTEWEVQLIDKVNLRLDEGVTAMGKILELSDKKGWKWWKQWRKVFKKALREKGWFDPVAYRAMAFHLLAQLPILAAMVGVIFLAGPAGVIGLIFTVLMMMLSTTLPKTSEEGARLAAEWRNYRKALKKGPNNSFNRDEMGRHFVNAIALGLTQKQLEKRLSDLPPNSPIFLWVIPLTMGSSPADIASGLSTLASSGTSSFSGVSGVGGASAGSAGGGSGGGAG